MTLIDRVHALLFAADSPATPEELTDALGVPTFEIEEALEELGSRLASHGPVQLVRIAGGYQLSTKPEFADAVARFLTPKEQKLSRSLLEVLAIVAYKQPITLAEVDEVRGVQSDYSVRTLAEKRLVAPIGRKHAPGRPVLYGTTQQFLHLFNLSDLSDLPAIELSTGEVLRAAQLPDKKQPALEFAEDGSKQVD